MVDVAAGPVLDSDVLIDYLRGRGPGRELIAGLLEPRAFRVTAISALELSLGRAYARTQRRSMRSSLPLAYRLTARLAYAPE